MNINLFHFDRTGNTIVASNGPITVVLEITDTGLKVIEGGTNVRVDAPSTARIALAAARWNRKNQSCISSHREWLDEKGYSA